MQKFIETGLDPDIIKAIKELGFEVPTEIQELTIPHLLKNENDLVALAQTGTGKTAAFGLPIIQKTDVSKNSIQALILCPTRELCMQITGDLENYSKHTKRLSVTAVYGGANIDGQIKALNRGTHIVVGTPGRTIDLINRNKLDVSAIKFLVLDEADEMLNMGFKEDLDIILESVPAKRQTMLFSATMPPEIARIAENYMNNPEKITVGKKNTGAENVYHIYYAVNASDRYLALKRVADINPNIYGMIFCRTRKETKEVADSLMADGYNADALHGDLSQAQRDQVMGRFRGHMLQLLVATDVAARGIDVQDISHVINYNLPDELEAYIHRSGRTGRAGKSGISISIVTPREVTKIKLLERMINKTFERKQIPGGREICEKQLFNLIDKVEKIEVNHDQIDDFLPSLLKKLEWLDRDELIARFVSVEFNRFLSYYKDASNLNVRIQEEGAAKRKKKLNFTRFYINVGAKNHLNTARLIGMINEHSGIRNIEIGKIDVLKNFSFFECDSRFDKEIIKGLNNKVEVDGVRVFVEQAGETEERRVDKKPVKKYEKKFEKKPELKKSRRFGDKSAPRRKF